jgi:flagellar basal-body rod protein FlgC
MTIAASGMAAAMTSLTVTASNVANAMTTGPVPDGARPPESVYQPATIVETSLSNGGVSATVIRAPDYSLSYQPAVPFANVQGMVAVPNIDLAAQMVNQISASIAFRANVKVFQIAARNQKSLIDMLA